jgi:hypothetical protein
MMMWHSSSNEDMDAFFSFALKKNVGYLFWLFLTSYSRICELPRASTDISFENILEAVQSLASEPLSPQELAEYSGLIYETMLKPKYRTYRGASLCMKAEISKNIDLYFHQIVKVMEERKADSNQSVEEIEAFLSAFRREVSSHLEFSKLAQLQDTGGGLWNGTNLSENHAGISSSQRFPMQSSLLSMQGFNASSSSRDEQISDVERNDGVVRLLAYIRKGGMDIIFPQLIHDKVSEIIYFMLAMSTFNY